MGEADEAKGQRADRAVDEQSPLDFAEVEVARQVGEAALVQQDVGSWETRCAPGLPSESSS